MADRPDEKGSETAESQLQLLRLSVLLERACVTHKFKKEVFLLVSGATDLQKLADRRTKTERGLSVEEIVKCPFFVTDKKGLIVCEGYRNPRYGNVSRFESVEEKKAFMVEYCYRDNCTEVCYYAKRLLAKYEKEEKGKCTK